MEFIELTLNDKKGSKVFVNIRLVTTIRKLEFETIIIFDNENIDRVLETPEEIFLLSKEIKTNN